MSIRPEYARAIFSGEKQFEFRRRVFKRPVTTVVVYVTIPVGMVLGEFDVAGVIEDDVARLWHRTSSAAGIDEEQFFRYFDGKDVGYAIEIGEVRRYPRPMNVRETVVKRPPQSYAYMP